MAKEQPIRKERYYYKKDGKAAYNLREPLSNILKDTTGYEEITKEEWDALTATPVHEPTAEEVAKQEALAEIATLKANLARTDYCIIKIAEGVATPEEYADVIAQRAEWRSQINSLESEIE